MPPLGRGSSRARGPGRGSPQPEPGPPRCARRLAGGGCVTVVSTMGGVVTDRWRFAREQGRRASREARRRRSAVPPADSRGRGSGVSPSATRRDRLSGPLALVAARSPPRGGSLRSLSSRCSSWARSPRRPRRRVWRRTSRSPPPGPALKPSGSPHRSPSAATPARSSRYRDSTGHGCDTRAMTSSSAMRFGCASWAECRILGGTWRDPYGGAPRTHDPRSLDIDIWPACERLALGGDERRTTKRRAHLRRTSVRRLLLAVDAGLDHAVNGRDGPEQWPHRGLRPGSPMPFARSG